MKNISLFMPKGTCPLPYIKIGMNIQKTKKSIKWRVEDIIPDGPDYNDMMAMLVSNSDECKIYCENLIKWILAEDYNPLEYVKEKCWVIDHE